MISLLRSVSIPIECTSVPLLRCAPEWILLCRGFLSVRGYMARLAVWHSTRRVCEVGRPVAVLDRNDRWWSDIVVVDVAVGVRRERGLVAEVRHGVVVAVAGSEIGRLATGVAVEVDAFGALVVLPFTDAPEGENDDAEDEDADADEGTGDCTFVVPKARRSVAARLWGRRIRGRLVFGGTEFVRDVTRRDGGWKSGTGEDSGAR